MIIARNGDRKICVDPNIGRPECAIQLQAREVIETLLYLNKALLRFSERMSNRVLQRPAERALKQLSDNIFRH